MTQEVYAGKETVLTLISPIDGSTLQTVTYTHDASFSDRIVYAKRTAHRSSAVVAPVMRAQGSVTIKKDADTLALAAEIKRWNAGDGVWSYPLSTNLKGVRYRHPHLRMTLTNGDGVTIEQLQAYDVKISDRTLSRSDGLVSDSITLDALGGIDTPNNDHGEPVGGLVAFRPGIKNIIGAAGTLSTVADGVAGFGVPYGTYSAAKAGIVLEGAATNLLTSNQATGTDTGANTIGFTAGPAGTVTLSSDTTAGKSFQGSRALKCVAAGDAANQGVTVDAIAATAGQTYAFQAMLLGNTPGQSLKMDLVDNGTVPQAVSATVVTLGSYQFISGTITASAGSTTVKAQVYNNGTFASTFWLDALMWTLSPFPTSWVDGTRNADLCAFSAPSNFLLWSERPDIAATYIVGGTSSAQPTSAGLWTLGNVDNTLYQALTPNISPSSTPWTYTVGLKAGTLSGSVQIQIEDQAGTLIGAAVTVNTSALSASTTHWAVTATPGASVTGLRVKIKGNAGTGNVTIVSQQLEPGSMSGVYCRTTDTAITKTPGTQEWPSKLTQNGSIKWTAIHPYSTGPSFVTFGNGQYQDISGYRDPGLPNVVRMSRLHNGVSGSLGTPGYAEVTGGGSDITAPHVYEMTWGNYTLGGVRHMPLSLYVDGVLAQTIDVAALYGATAWSVPERLRLSTGSTITTLLSLVISPLAATGAAGQLPLGAIPS